MVAWGEWGVALRDVLLHPRLSGASFCRLALDAFFMGLVLRGPYGMTVSILIVMVWLAVNHVVMPQQWAYWRLWRLLRRERRTGYCEPESTNDAP